MRKRTFLYRVLSIGVALLFLFVTGLSAIAQEDSAAEETATEETAAEETAADEVAMATMDDVAAVQFNLDLTWVLLAGFLVFFMQAGFAMLEGGFIQHTGVVNSMAENFMDAALTGIAFFAVGFGIAYGTTAGGFLGTDTFFLNFADGTNPGDGELFVSWFFQFAFAGAAGTIATGAMAERTDFRGKMLYSFLLGLLIYPVVVHWVWQGNGWLTNLGFLDFAGSTVVHQVGGIVALVGAAVVGPRVGRKFGEAPKPSNMMLASLGTFILWFGWYGFNVGSTLAAGNVNLLGLVAVNTTLAAAMGAITAMFYAYATKGGKWDLSLILNGSLAGLVGITAGAAFMAPITALITGGIAGIIVVLAMDAVEAAKIDDAVGAFAVHGAAGAWGTLAVGLFGLGALTDGATGLLVGGSVEQLGIQVLGVALIAAWASVTGYAMFKAIDLLGLLRMPKAADGVGIDAYEHGASVWPDVLPLPEDSGDMAAGDAAAAPAAGD